MTFCNYYCFNCDSPSDDHRTGSCRRCGHEVTPLVVKDDSYQSLAIGGSSKRMIIEFEIEQGKEHTCIFCGAKHYGNFTQVIDKLNVRVLMYFCDGCRFAIQELNLFNRTTSGGMPKQLLDKCPDCKSYLHNVGIVESQCKECGIVWNRVTGEMLGGFAKC